MTLAKILIGFALLTGSANAAGPQVLNLAIEQTSHDTTDTFFGRNADGANTGLCVDPVHTGQVAACETFNFPMHAALTALGYIAHERVTARAGSKLGDYTAGCESNLNNNYQVCTEGRDVDPHWNIYPGRPIYYADGPTNDMADINDDGTGVFNRWAIASVKRRAGAPAGAILITGTIFARQWDIASYPWLWTAHRGVNSKGLAACGTSTVVYNNGFGMNIYQCTKTSTWQWDYLIDFAGDSRIGVLHTTGDTWDNSQTTYFAAGETLHTHLDGTNGAPIQRDAALHSIIAGIPVGIGRGCTTLWYIDKDCDGHGVAVRLDQVYGPPSVSGNNSTLIYSGNNPDADDNDPTVSTVADWHTKYGSGATDTSVATLRNFLTTVRGYTPARIAFIDAANGNDSTGCWWSASNPTCNPYTNPFATTNATDTTLADHAGGMVVFRGGTYSQLLTASAYGDSSSHRLFFIAYPGESVVMTSGDPIYVDFTFSATPVGFYTFDGFNFQGIGFGRNLNIMGSTGTIVRNCEITQHAHGMFFGDHTRTLLIEDNVFHDNDTHSIYVGYTTLQGNVTNTDYDFTQAETFWANPSDTHCVGQNNITGYWTDSVRCSSYSDGVTFQNNLLYREGGSGFDPIHLNTYGRNFHVIGNIIHNTGGTGIGFQTGIYDSDIQNNLVYANGNAAITLNLYGAACYPVGYPHDTTNPCHRQPANMRRIVVKNNTLWVGDGSAFTGIRLKGSTPTFGILASGPEDVDPGYHHISDVTVENNIILNDNTGVGSNSIAIGQDVDLTSWVIRNNFLYNMNSARSSTDTVMNVHSIYPSCQQFPVAGSCPGNSMAGTLYTFSAFTGLNGAWVNNHNTDPQVSGYPLDFLPVYPSLFDFRLQSTSPAIGAAYAADLPSTDVTGATRTTADVGAVAFGGTVACAISLSPSNPGPYTVGYTIPTLTATATNCGAGTKTWTTTGLPTGLSGCNAVTGTSCTISGTTTTAGIFNSISIGVSDGGSNSATISPAITVNARPVVSFCTGSTTICPNGNQQVAYSNPVVITGGSPIVQCAVTTGALPLGLTITNCVITGTPTGFGTSTFKLTATDANGIASVESNLFSLNVIGQGGGTAGGITYGGKSTTVGNVTAK